MTPLALFGILYLIYLPFKKKPPKETMSQFLESIGEIYHLTPPIYGMRKRKEKEIIL